MTHISSLSHMSILGCAAIFAATLAGAQSTASPASTGWSSSQAGLTEIAEAAAPALPSAPESAGQQQEGTTYSGWHARDLRHRLTWEASGGFNAPAGDKTYITWGGQFTVGGGINFNRYLAMMIEYQFLDDKIPGAVVAESGADGGHYHIWSFTMDPVVDLTPRSSNDIYVTGGGGFYRKVTDFTDVVPAEYCDFYYGCGIVGENQTVGSFSSNQGGVNIGAGYARRIGGMYGENHGKLFVEARYLHLFSPAVYGSANGLGVTAIGQDTKLIPVSFGYRW